MIINIKGIRKWRITHDDLNWIIQERKSKNKPPNDWVNRFHFQKLSDLVSFLAELGIKDEKLTDVRKVLTKLTRIQTNLKAAVEEMELRLLAQNVDVVHEPPASKRICAVKRSSKKR